MTIAPAEPTPSRPPAPRATIAEWLAIPEDRRAELIDGRIVYQGMPGPVHGRVQGNVFSARGPRFDRGCRPDVLGWRRDRVARLPQPDARGVVVEVPDGICEVLSASTASVDTGRKREAYHRAGVAHYWLADPERRSITVLRSVAEGYVILGVHHAGERRRAEPFEAVEVALDEAFADDVE